MCSLAVRQYRASASTGDRKGNKTISGSPSAAALGSGLGCLSNVSWVQDGNLDLNSNPLSTNPSKSTYKSYSSVLNTSTTTSLSNETDFVDDTLKSSEFSSSNEYFVLSTDFDDAILHILSQCFLFRNKKTLSASSSSGSSRSELENMSVGDDEVIKDLNWSTLTRIQVCVSSRGGLNSPSRFNGLFELIPSEPSGVIGKMALDTTKWNKVAMIFDLMEKVTNAAAVSIAHSLSFFNGSKAMLFEDNDDKPLHKKHSVNLFFCVKCHHTLHSQEAFTNCKCKAKRCFYDNVIGI